MEFYKSYSIWLILYILSLIYFDHLSKNALKKFATSMSLKKSQERQFKIHDVESHKFKFWLVSNFIPKLFSNPRNFFRMSCYFYRSKFKFYRAQLGFMLIFDRFSGWILWLKSFKLTNLLYIGYFFITEEFLLFFIPFDSHGKDNSEIAKRHWTGYIVCGRNFPIRS